MSKNSVFGSSGELVSRLDMLESRKQNLNKVLDDLKAAFAKVDARMEVLERTPKATPRLLKTKKPRHKRSKRTVTAQKQSEAVIFLEEIKEKGDQPEFESRIKAKHRKTPKEEDTQDQNPKLEVSYFVEVFQKEEQVHGCHEAAMFVNVQRLLLEENSNEEIGHWIQNNLTVQQRSSHPFIGELVRAVAETAFVGCGSKKNLDVPSFLQRAGLLKKYMGSEENQLVALNVLQELVIQMEQPDCLLRMLFDVLLDEDVIQEDTFFKWESSAQMEKMTSLRSFFRNLGMAARMLGL